MVTILCGQDECVSVYLYEQNIHSLCLLILIVNLITARDFLGYEHFFFFRADGDSKPKKDIDRN